MWAYAALKLLAIGCVGLADALPPGQRSAPRTQVARDGGVASSNEEKDHKGESDQVTLTASGGMHRPSSMMRRHANHEHEQEVFSAFDLNGDGVASTAEVKASFEQSGRPVPKDLSQILRKMDGNHDGDISLAEFLAVAKHEHELLKDEDKGHHRQHRHHHGLKQGLENYLEVGADREALVDEAALLGKALMKEAAEEEAAAKVKLGPDGGDDSWVTCGGHKAPTCAACVSTDSSGRTVFDHGSEWCHGDCVYHQNNCHKVGTVTVPAGGSQGVARGYDTTPLPNMFNHSITPTDERTIDNAAEAAIREENLEAAQKAREEEEAIEAKKFSWSKFWLISCITIAVILGVCACVSVCAICIYVFMPSSGKKGDDDDDDGEEGEGKKEGEEGDGKAEGAEGEGKAAEAEAEAPAEATAEEAAKETF